jgi:acetolactate synthase-1/2/3 large subunit
MSVSSFIYNKLLQKNVKNVFMYSGGSIMPLIDQFYKGRINYYVNNHEQNCGHAATGYAKSSGNTGISIVTSGPGITNSITPLLDAMNDSTPLIVFSGNVPLSAIGSNAFQEAPAVDITRPVTKWSYCLDNVDDVEYVIDEAFRVANDGKKGSVHIDLPKCILTSQVNCKTMNIVENPKYYDIGKYYNSPVGAFFGTQPNICQEASNNVILDDNAILDDYVVYSNMNITEREKYMKVVCDVINKADKPILYVGQGCNNAYLELRQIAKKNNIPVTTTLHALGVYDESDVLSLGMCGMHGHAAANYALQESDCIIALGSRFDDRTTGNVNGYAPKCKNFIHINIEMTEINKVINTDYNIVGDCLSVLPDMLKYLEVNCRDELVLDIIKKKSNNPYKYLNTTTIKTQDVLKVLNNLTLMRDYDKYYFTSGVGNHQMMATQYMTWKLPTRFVTSGSLGVMGVGLPYAIGVQVAHPDKVVINIDGDSSFQMTCGDLKTIAEHNLPIKILILNNGCQDMVRVWENLFFEKRETATINTKNPSFVKLAEAYGIKGIYCKNKIDLPQCMNRFLNYDGPIIMECKTMRDMCLPLVPPKANLDEMILYNSYKEDIKRLGNEAPS